MRLPPGLRPGPRWGAYSAPQTPSFKALGQAKINPPPPSKSWLRACIARYDMQASAVKPIYRSGYLTI